MIDYTGGKVRIQTTRQSRNSIVKLALLLLVSILNASIVRASEDFAPEGPTVYNDGPGAVPAGPIPQLRSVLGTGNIIPVRPPRSERGPAMANDAGNSAEEGSEEGETSAPSTNNTVSKCAQDTLLAAAKKEAKNRWKNRSRMGGKCALAVRIMLQRAGVKSIKGGIGHAADFYRRLPGHGFVDTGIREPKNAPPGSVIVYAGPKTKQYFATGRAGRPWGTWVGHVAIKGNDDYYYTDGKIKNAAVGWRSHQKLNNARTVIGIFVPGKALSGVLCKK